MSIAGTLEWTVFAALVAGLLVVDIAYASRGARGRSRRKAWIWSGIWIGIALAFGLWIAIRLGAEAGLTYLTAYFLEKSLSIDNLAVIAMVFSQTGIPPALQHRALFWGVIGALVMRAVLIAFGIYLLERFHWIVYPFGLLLAWSALRMLKEEPRRPWAETSCALCSSWISRFIPILPEPQGERFLAKVDGKRYATPLLVALVAIESADLVFAVDSITAVFAVTRDPFLVYTSNVFALLGLRSLYAVVGGLIKRFRYLRTGVAVLLAFVAAKLVLTGIVAIPVALSLGVIVLVIAAAVAASRFLPNPPRPKQPVLANCAHRDEMKVQKPARRECAKCKASGDKWVQLRMCMTCGHVGCCDSSQNKHATAHFEETRHPIMRSIESGESWKWCYVDKSVID